MSWITMAWSMASAVCGTLAVVHLAIWFERRSRTAHLLFALSALAAAAHAERVFEPFFTTKSHGMGLGLAVCRTILSGHGGRLWAESGAGPGATVHFTLPAESRPSA